MCLPSVTGLNCIGFPKLLSSRVDFDGHAISLSKFKYYYILNTVNYLNNYSVLLKYNNEYKSSSVLLRSRYV